MSWQSAIERTVQGLGYDMVDTERTVGGLLRVTIDRLPEKVYGTGPGESVLVEDCELVTRQLQFVLEVEAVEYERLEVSSPGLDRPLRRQSDFERFAGSDIELALRVPFEGRRKWSGRLLVCDDGGLSLVLPVNAPVKSAKSAKTTKISKPNKSVKPPAPAKAAEGKKKIQAEQATEQTLDFSLDEVRDARLVPVFDFKGPRRSQGAVAKQDGGQNP